MNSKREQALQDWIREATGATQVLSHTTLQRLWSDYGRLDRYQLAGAAEASVIAKHVQLPDTTNHPRGWNTDQSHRRKWHSYAVEMAWYRSWVQQCDARCRVPHSRGLQQTDQGFVMLLEDLQNAGFTCLNPSVNESVMSVCLTWLANFHAKFMHHPPKDLWPVGTYWHLETRPDEWQAMEEGSLKQYAARIDQQLTGSTYLTLVHGDAKLANFCFTADQQQVAAVDFQYVGGGCGMKDVAYFISSCLDEDACEQHAGALLDVYFSALSAALASDQPTIDATAVEAEWRPLYALAWTDFYRFLKGWSPGHWKIHGYSERLAQQTINMYIN